MAQKTCPKCGERNSVEAVACSACYSSLPEGSPLFAVLSSIDWDYIPGLIALIGGLVLMIASGWLPQRMRVATLVAGILLFGSLIIWTEWCKWRDHRAWQVQVSSPKGAFNELDVWPDRHPIIGFTNTILSYALRDGATRIHLETFRKGVQFQYEINGEWRGEMQNPQDIWPEMVEHLKTRANLDETGNGSFVVTMKGVSHPLRLRREFFDPQERLTLEIREGNPAA